MLGTNKVGFFELMTNTLLGETDFDNLINSFRKISTVQTAKQAATFTQTLHLINVIVYKYYLVKTKTII